MTLDDTPTKGDVAARTVTRSALSRIGTNEVGVPNMARERVSDERRHARGQEQHDSITATVVTVKRRATEAPIPHRASVDGEPTQVVVVTCPNMTCRSCVLATPSLNHSPQGLSELTTFIAQVLGRQLPCVAHALDQDRPLVVPRPPRAGEMLAGEHDRVTPPSPQSKE